MNAYRTFVLGDVHGAYKALLQCLQRADFRYEQDRLIVLGDVCDGWPEVNLCFDELLRVKHLHFILGNHDYWARIWMDTGEPPEYWLPQGGQGTIDSYQNGFPAAHYHLLQDAMSYYLLENRLFVHAGILPDVPLEAQDNDIFLWDRSLCHLALGLKQQGREQQIGSFEEIYFGHTPTIRSGYNEPIQSGNIWMMDTGAAWNGRLSLMDIHSKEVYQSDTVPDLYPGIKGR